jgi:hypothetical protein
MWWHPRADVMLWQESNQFSFSSLMTSDLRDHNRVFSIDDLSWREFEDQIMTYLERHDKGCLRCPVPATSIGAALSTIPVVVPTPNTMRQTYSVGIAAEVALHSIRQDQVWMQRMVFGGIQKFVPASTFLAAFVNIEKTPVSGAGSLDALKGTSRTIDLTTDATLKVGK